MVIKTIVFDLNRVLVTYKWESNGQYRKLTGMAGKTFWEEVRKVFNDYNIGKVDIKGLFTRVFEDLGLDKSTIPDLVKLHEKSFYVLPGMVDILEALKDDYKLILFAGDGKDSFYFKVYGFDLDKYFPEVTLTSYEGFNKKSEELYKILISNHNLDPKECLFIDDIETHVELAEAVGFNAIHFKDAKQLKKEMAKFGVKV